jgi:hypothetical protein
MLQSTSKHDMQSLHRLCADRYITFPGVCDPCTLLSAAAFRGFLVMLPTTELTEKARFLYLLFE